MMTLFFLITSSFSEEIPRISILMAGKYYEECVQQKTWLEEMRKDCPTMSDKNENYQYCQYLDYYMGEHCLKDVSAINNELSKISKNTQVLSIDVYTDSSVSIDLNKLPSKMMVGFEVIQSEDESTQSRSLKKFNKISQKYNFNAISKIIEKKRTHIKPSRSNAKKAKGDLLFSLVGNINNKVNLLYVYSQLMFKITESDLNTEIAILEFSKIDAQSKGIRAKQLMVNGDAHINFLNFPKLVKVDQYGIYLPDGGLSNQIQIQWAKDQWVLNHKDSSTGQWVNYNVVPYSFAQIFGYIGLAELIELSIPSADALTEKKDLNISSFKPSMQYLEEETKRKLSITNSGDGWKNLAEDKLPTVYVTANTTEVEVKISDDLKNKGVVNEAKPYVPSYKDDDDDGPNVGMIVGIVVGCVVAVAVIIIVVVLVVKKKKSQVGNGN